MNQALLFIFLTACGGAAFRAGASSDALQEDSGVRQGNTDGGLGLLDGGAAPDTGIALDGAVVVEAASDSASPDARSDAHLIDEDAGPPTTAAEADNAIGCCFGNTLYYGNEINGVYNLVSVNCTNSNTECAWGGSIGGGNDYECADPGNVVDASGPPQYPIACQ